MARTRTLRGRAAASAVSLAALAGLFLLAPRRGLAALGGGSCPPPGADSQAASPTLDVPASEAATLAAAWKKVDGLAKLVEKKGIVPDFGKRAEAIVDSAVSEAATGSAARSLEQLLDARLLAMFQRQLQELTVRCADLYEAVVEQQPNPLEAARSAEEAFCRGADGLVRPGSSWSYEAEREDLVALVSESQDADAQLVESQANQGRGKQITIEVIKKLQEQEAAVRQEANTRGAFPWNMKWQYFIENSPVGFRGQYMQGRSVVELLLMPSPDPRYKKNLLNRIGPLNLAVAFDMLL